MENPLEKYRFKFEKDSWEPVSIEEIEAFESDYSIVFPTELKQFYQLYNGSYLEYKYLPRVSIRDETDPHGLNKDGGITIDDIYKIKDEFYPGKFSGSYPGKPSVVDYDMLPLDALPFEQWSQEEQENNPWYEDWYPEKAYEYLKIGQSQGTGYLLIGMTAKNFGQLFHWDPDVKEKYNPSYVAASISEMLERLIEW